MSEAYIVAVARTASGTMGGRLKEWHATDLAAEILNAATARAAIETSAVEHVFLGCAVQTGEQAGDVARNAVLASKLPQSVPAATIGRQCGSSHQALHFATQAILSGAHDVVIAGGVESLSRVPFASAPLSERIKERYSVDDFNLIVAAELLTKKYGFSRDDLDAFALSSHRRAAAATKAGLFDHEIVAIAGSDGALHRADEGIRYDATLEKINAVKPIIEDGKISPSGSSYLCDGASAVMLVSSASLRKYDLVPLARVHAMAVTAGDPVMMLDEPINATQTVLKRAGLSISDIDLYEVSESFSAIPLAWLRQMGAQADRLNVNGGALALGHPVGASGTKLTATLVQALRARRGRFGLQVMCEGGGTSHATIIEAL